MLHFTTDAGFRRRSWCGRHLQDVDLDPSPQFHVCSLLHAQVLVLCHGPLCGGFFLFIPLLLLFSLLSFYFFTSFLCLPLLLYSLHFGARIKAFWSFKTVNLIICYLFCLSEWWTLPGTTALGARPLAQCSKTIHSTSRPWPVWR